MIKLYEAFEYNNTLFLVLDYCKGGELKSYINRPKLNLSFEVKQEILRQTFTAMSYIHQMGIIHRDVKPENILLVNELDSNSKVSNVKVKVVDFGLSIMASEKKYNQNWKTVGSRNYMAPEVFKGLYSSKCDVWGCGVTMHMLLLGSNPFFF